MKVFNYLAENFHQICSVAGVSTSDEPDPLTDPPSTSNGGAAVFPPPASFNVMSNWIFDGIDISKVRNPFSPFSSSFSCFT